MRYWWVNHKQTYKYEVDQGFLWSPKERQDGAYHQFYENMREVAPGDVVLSYASAALRAWGRATSFCYDAARPPEFTSWVPSGWRVDVAFSRLERSLRTKDHIDKLRAFLPAKYSPIRRRDGDGQQGVYLAELEEALALRLIQMMNEGGIQIDLTRSAPAEVDEQERTASWDTEVENELAADDTLKDTEREQLVNARRGQGLFREHVRAVEPLCRISGTSNPTYLIASHIKPWRHCDNRERLDRYNGLMLAPHFDFLFDRGFISFSDDGTVLVSPVADAGVVTAFGLDPTHPPRSRPFAPQQRAFLAFHRRNVLKKAGAK